MEDYREFELQSFTVTKATAPFRKYLSDKYDPLVKQAKEEYINERLKKELTLIEGRRQEEDTLYRGEVKRFVDQLKTARPASTFRRVVFTKVPFRKDNYNGISQYILQTIVDLLSEAGYECSTEPEKQGEDHGDYDYDYYVEVVVKLQ